MYITIVVISPTKFSGTNLSRRATPVILGFDHTFKMNKQENDEIDMDLAELLRDFEEIPPPVTVVGINNIMEKYPDDLHCVLGGNWGGDLLLDSADFHNIARRYFSENHFQSPSQCWQNIVHEANGFAASQGKISFRMWKVILKEDRDSTLFEEVRDLHWNEPAFKEIIARAKKCKSSFCIPSRVRTSGSTKPQAQTQGSKRVAVVGYGDTQEVDQVVKTAKEEAIASRLRLESNNDRTIETLFEELEAVAELLVKVFETRIEAAGGIGAEIPLLSPIAVDDFNKVFKYGIDLAELMLNNLRQAPSEFYDVFPCQQFGRFQLRQPGHFSTRSKRSGFESIQLFYFRLSCIQFPYPMNAFRAMATAPVLLVISSHHGLHHVLPIAALLIGLARARDTKLKHQPFLLDASPGECWMNSNRSAQSWSVDLERLFASKKLPGGTVNRKSQICVHSALRESLTIFLEDFGGDQLSGTMVEQHVAEVADSAWRVRQDQLAQSIMDSGGRYRDCKDARDFQILCREALSCDNRDIEDLLIHEGQGSFTIRKSARGSTEWIEGRNQMLLVLCVMGPGGISAFRIFYDSANGSVQNLVSVIWRS